MHIRFYIILLLIVNTITISCTTTINNPTHHTADDYYKKIHEKLLHKNYNEAVQDLLNLQNLYLFDPYPQQIHLSLIYAYYKSNDLKSANNSIQHFLTLYPNYKDLDYILYMQGIVNMSLDKNNMSFFAKNINIYGNYCNPKYANYAFRSFSKLIQNYPNSQYCIDAYKRLVILKNRIAEYELSIIKFYDEKHAYVSVIIRSEKMLRYFSDTQATLQALHYMKRAYHNLRLIEQSNKIAAVIAENLTIY